MTNIPVVQTAEQKINTFIVRQWTWVLTHSVAVLVGAGIGALLGYVIGHYVK